MTDYGIFHQDLFFKVHLFSITLFNCSTNTIRLFFQYFSVTLFTFIFMKHINNLVIVTLILNERRTMAARLFKPLQNGRYVKVSEWKKEPRVDFRQYELCNGQEIPTKKGISLKMIQLKNLLSVMDSVQETLSKLASGIQRLHPSERKQPLCGYSSVLETERRVRHCSY